MVLKVSREQLFRGFSSQDNNKNVIYDIDMVNTDLINHFQTRIGERVMMPNYGCIIWDLLFEPFTDGLRSDIVNNVTDIINLDSRVALEEITVDEFEFGIIIEVELLYRPFDVVRTFSLEFDKRAL